MSIWTLANDSWNIKRLVLHINPTTILKVGSLQMSNLLWNRACSNPLHWEIYGNSCKESFKETNLMGGINGGSPSHKKGPPSGPNNRTRTHWVGTSILTQKIWSSQKEKWLSSPPQWCYIWHDSWPKIRTKAYTNHSTNVSVLGWLGGVGKWYHRDRRTSTIPFIGEE